VLPDHQDRLLCRNSCMLRKGNSLNLVPEQHQSVAIVPEHAADISRLHCLWSSIFRQSMANALM